MEDIHTTKPSQHTTVGLVPRNDDIMLNCISFKSIKYIHIWIWLTEFCGTMYVLCWVMELWRNVPRIVSRKK